MWLVPSNGFFTLEDEYIIAMRLSVTQLADSRTVHCRRRKIRCLAAADDAQGRCENCIRLRKECQYFPVDQQPPVEKKSRPSSRVGPASADHSAPTSSPSTVGGSEQRDFFQYQPIPLTSNQEIPNLGASNFAGNPMPPFTPGSCGPFIPRTPLTITDRNVAPPEYVTPQSIDPSVPWDEFTTIQDPQMLAAMNAQKSQMMNMQPNVWNPGGAPVAPMPSHSPMPTTPSAPQSQTMTPAPGFTMQPDGSVWPVQPTRSMTYPPPEMPSPYSQFPSHGIPDMKQRMSSAQAIHGGPVNSQSPMPDIHAQQIPVSYPGQQMEFPAYQNMNTMPMNMMPYQMYTGDPPQASFMGHPSQQGHHSSGA